MTFTNNCRICAEPSALLYEGNASLMSTSFSPTSHTPGAFGNLYKCSACGSVDQPDLPETLELTDQYREVIDSAYLKEEDGRRATANRLLDYIERQVPHGRFLEVGCSYGFMLDEAAKRGYDVSGIELSRSAAEYVRTTFGHTVHELPVEEFEVTEPFDVIVMADVLEHVTDPRGVLDHCRRLLRPGGVLLLTTPDPSSVVARVAGRRWWGYVPAHTVLIPRLTLRELVAGAGFTISTDVSLVRSFTLDYWVAGLKERSKVLAAVGEAVAMVAGARKITLSLGDERVLVAHRLEPLKPERPMMTDRGLSHRVHVVLPAHNAAVTIPQVAQEIPAGCADRTLLVDDASTDATTQVALAHGFDVLRHPVNRGYGANQMTCYQRALMDGADVIVMVHADNQYDPGLIAEMARPIQQGLADMVIGSRLLDDRAVSSGMPRWKWVGNRFLTEIENAAFRRKFSEYHTGYRAFSADFLRSVAFLRNSDDFVFDQEIFAQAVARDARILELPIPTRYFLEASSVSFRQSVRYGLRTLRVLRRFRLDERRHDWLLLRPPAARFPVRPEQLTAAEEFNRERAAI